MYSPAQKRWLHLYFATKCSYHVVQSSALDAFESLKLSSHLPDRGGGLEYGERKRNAKWNVICLLLEEQEGCGRGD